MSQQTATVRVAPRPTPRRAPAPQPLRVVPAAVGQPGNGLFAALCVLLLTGGLVALLMLNTAMAEGSFTLHDLEATSGELADTQEALTTAIDAQRSPGHLASRALQLGMVPSESAAFLRLSDGKVLGVAKPAKKDAGFSVVTAPQQPKAKAGAGATKATRATAPRTTVTTKGDVTTTTVTVTKPDGSVVTTVTSVNARTRATTSTTTTTPAPSTKPTKPTKPTQATTPSAR